MTDPQDIEGNKQPDVMGFPTTHHDEGKTSSEVEPDTETLLLTIVADIQSLLGDSDDELKYDSDDEEPFSTEYQFTSPKKDNPKPLNAKKSADSQDASDSESSSCSKTFKPYDNFILVTKRVLAVVSYADLRGAVKGYTEENVKHIAQTDTLLSHTMDLIDTINKARVEEITSLLKTLNRVSETLETDSTLKEGMQKMAYTNTTTSDNITIVNELLRTAHMELEERKEKAAQEAKLLAFSNPELIKVVTNVATKAGVDPKALQILKKKRIDQYRWTTTFEPERITNIHIYPNTKHVIITVYMDNDKRNFDVHKPFRFGDFGVTELDELGAIIPKKKNKVVEELMTSFQKKYERLKLILEEIGITPSLPASEHFPYLSSGRKRKAQELELEQRIFFIDVFSDEAFQRMSDIQKVDMDTLLSYLVMASNINTLANQRFCTVMRSMIESHPDKGKLKSKRVKLEAIRYSLK
ncbi:hypothetical protein Tco_0167570 [Tanacetum coccineum]